MVLKACESQGEGASESTSGQANGDKNNSTNNKRKGKPPDNGLQSTANEDSQASSIPATKKVLYFLLLLKLKKRYMYICLFVSGTEVM